MTIPTDPNASWDGTLPPESYPKGRQKMIWLVVTGTWMDAIFATYWECHPNWRFVIFIRGVAEPPTSWTPLCWSQRLSRTGLAARLGLGRIRGISPRPVTWMWGFSRHGKSAGKAAWKMLISATKNEFLISNSSDQKLACWSLFWSWWTGITLW